MEKVDCFGKISFLQDDDNCLVQGQDQVLLSLMELLYVSSAKVYCTFYLHFVFVTLLTQVKL